MLVIFIKSAVLFVLLLLVIRIMGKRQIGEMQPFELVITLIVAEVACIPMTDPSIPFSYGLIPILTLTAVHYFISLLGRKSLIARGLISGKPVIVITPDGIDYKNLKSLNMTVHDLIEATRGEGYFNLEEIHYAVFETNGKICIMPKSEYAPVTMGDMNKYKPEPSLPVTLVVDGKYIRKHLEEKGITEAMLLREMTLSKIKNIKDVTLITINDEGSLYIQPKNKKFVVRQMQGGGK